VVAAISYLSLVLGELVPKSLALRASERYALLVARPLLYLSWIARPLVRLLTASSNLVLLPFGDRTTFIEARMSRDELTQIVEGAARAGSVARDVGEIASRAIEFGELVAADVMVPRNRVVALPDDADHEEVQKILAEHGHTRMPAFGKSLDDVIGYVTAKDVLARLSLGKRVVLREIVRPAQFVPESMRATELLRSMQRQRVHLAIVVDEHGGMAGLVTLEDLIEELVGEIFSEHDAPAEVLARDAEGRVVVRGQMTIRDLNRALGLSLPEDGDWTTVGGMCVALAGRIPQRGDRLEAPDGTVLEIVEASAKLVKMVRVVPPRDDAWPPAQQPV
jgi:putative hemolysin